MSRLFVSARRAWVFAAAFAALLASAAFIASAALGADSVYWTNDAGDSISFANLNGSGGGNLPVVGATVAGPQGTAIDPATGRIYWANYDGNKISFANLDGSGGADLNTAGATVNEAGFPALLKTPSATAAPAITGRAAPHSRLSCSQGSWAPDLLGSFLYQAAQGFAYQWSRNGADLAGATSDSLVASSVGNYACRVIAQNYADSAAKTSALRAIFRVGKAKLNKDKGTATLPVTVPGAGKVTLTGKGVVKQRPGRRDRGTLARTVGKAGKVKLLVKAKGKRKRKLNSKGKVRVKVKVAFTPRGGSANAQRKTIKLRKKLG
jgi:hypothetical protein